MIVDSPCALDVETYAVKAKETKDPRTAQFVCAAIAPQGLVTLDPPRVEATAQVAVHNIPYDPVVLGVWDAHWDDSKVLAHLAGYPDTTLQGLVTKVLRRSFLHHGEAIERGVLPECCLSHAQGTWELLDRIDLPPGPRRLYEELEKPLLPLWAKMTLEGSFRLDGPALEEYRAALAGEVDYLLAQVHADLPAGRVVSRCKKCELLRERMEKGQRCDDGKHHSWDTHFDADEPINLNSPDQLLAVLNKLGLAVRDTGADTLRLVAEQHPAVRALLGYREKFKELSTYVDPWWEIVQSGRRLGAVWHPAGVWTGGRVSSSGPNLMNVPDPLERFFLAPEEGYDLLTHDNAQLEIRMMAHQSQDPVLLAACQGGDFHAEMQAILGLPSRKPTKVGVFGTMYLGGPAVILEQARKYDVPMTWREAEQLQALMYEKLPVYFRYAHRIAEEQVYEGLFGRIHHVPLGDKDYMGREAVNAGPQGGAGDVTKYQMLALWRAGYWVVRQVHDSVTVAVPHADLEDARVQVPAIMQSAAPELDVPIVVEEA